MRLLLGFSALVAALPAHAASLNDAQSLYSRNRVAEAVTAYSAVAADAAASADDRSEAERQLGRIAWLIDGEADKALQHLQAAVRHGAKPCDSSALIARVWHESDRDERAIESGEASLARCPEPAQRDAIRTHLIGARLDLAAQRPERRPRLLAEAVAEGKEFTIDADVESARVRLEAALMTSDAPAALAAWKDYFWLDEGDAPQALAAAGTASIFTNGLRPQASIENRLRLAELLMRAGFAVPSQRFAELHGLPSQAGGHAVLRRLQAYWSARATLEAALLRVNRSFAREGKTDRALQAGRVELDRADEAWRTTLLAAVPEKGDADALLTRHYGIVGTARGETSGYPSIHRGHLVEDRRMTVSQYGKTASIHYQSVDNMIGNGFESWLWDGGPMVGGWQADGKIVNVRPGYVMSPLRGWAQTQDSALRRELIGRQKQRAGEDVAKLKARPVATIDGLSDRLQLQLVDRIAAVARSKATSEADIRRAFLAEFTRANFDQSILKHEGRHAIDEMLGLQDKVDQPVIEYQAKLSELALAAYPRMALRNMNLNLEGDGPHDRAGAKLFSEYAKWIEAHPGEVMGYDPALPALVQIDKLSDDQIREIARTLDPLARGAPSPKTLEEATASDGIPSGTSR